jgi:hypothetical protein
MKLSDVIRCLNSGKEQESLGENSAMDNFALAMCFLRGIGGVAMIVTAGTAGALLPYYWGSDHYSTEESIKATAILAGVATVSTGVTVAGFFGNKLRTCWAQRIIDNNTVNMEAVSLTGKGPEVRAYRT